MKRAPYYPLLFAAYPVLALAAYNIHELASRDIWRPLLASLLLATIILGIAELLLRDWNRAALVTTIVLLIVLSYGQVYSELKNVSVAGLLLFRHRTLGAVWAILLTLGIIWASRWLKDPSPWTPWLNLIGALMLVYPVLLILSGTARNVAARAGDPTTSDASVALAGRPDVYYIILDAYARQDALRDEFGFDNSEFIDGLKERGFYVADCSQSNYAQTELSLGSSLNYNYLPFPGADGSDSTLLHRLLHSKVRTFFENHGYKTVAFPTGFSWIEWTDADIYPQRSSQLQALTEFEILFGKTTLLRIPMDLSAKTLVSGALNERYRQRTMNVLTTLKKIPGYPGDYLVYAHIVSPHPPYVFDADGNPVNVDTGDMSLKAQAAGYVAQAKFIGREILKVVDILQQDSDTPPIIIIQGDHGAPPADRELRMRNLSAYYLPGANAEDALYSSITPVNTFRIVLDTYFGQHLPLLEDESYFSSYQNKTNFQPVPPSCPKVP